MGLLGQEAARRPVARDERVAVRAAARPRRPARRRRRRPAPRSTRRAARAARGSRRRGTGSIRRGPAPRPRCGRGRASARRSPGSPRRRPAPRPGRSCRPGSARRRRRRSSASSASIAACAACSSPANGITTLTSGRLTGHPSPWPAPSSTRACSISCRVGEAGREQHQRHRRQHRGPGDEPDHAVGRQQQIAGGRQAAEHHARAGRAGATRTPPRTPGG